MNKLEFSIQLAQKCLEKAEPKGLSIKETADQVLECLELIYTKIEELEQKNKNIEELEEIKSVSVEGIKSVVSVNDSIGSALNTATRLAFTSDISDFNPMIHGDNEIFLESFFSYLRPQEEKVTSVEIGRSYEVVNTQWRLEVNAEDNLLEKDILASLLPDRAFPFIKDLDVSQSGKFIKIEGAGLFRLQVNCSLRQPAPGCTGKQDNRCPLPTKPPLCTAQQK